MAVIPKIVWPIPANNRGGDFGTQEELLAHLDGESTGLFLIGRNGMWHGGIHITHMTTPWCALSGKEPVESVDFPVAYEGEQAVRCMVDGEVVAYRICRDYQKIAWCTGLLNVSGSFVLVRHYIQPGETEKSGLRFYTLYMHLAPYSAYKSENTESTWKLKSSLSAYTPEWLMVASTNNPDSVNNNYRAGTMPEGARVEWEQADSGRRIRAFNQREYGLVTFRGLSDEAIKKGTKVKFEPGQQYWILVDKNNLVSDDDNALHPTWWRALLPPAKEGMAFDQVVCPTPYPVSAGDPVGHLGYYQAAKQGSYEARYQVHIECFSMDENLSEFLKNPEQVGVKNPLWLKYSPGLVLYKKDLPTGTFKKDGRVTERTGIVTLSQVPTEMDKTTKQEYWHLRRENGYVPKGQAQPELLSQFDLAKLGFTTETAEPSTFDYLDGKTQPVGLVRHLFDQLFGAAKDDPRTSHALVKYNYQRLLDRIDSGTSNYSSAEYLSALHNADYRDVLRKSIVKHPSEWYYKKSDAIWQPFLSALTTQAPEWKKYGEDFLDKMIWMQDVTTEKLGPELWHMHPVMFLSSLIVLIGDIKILRLKAFLRMIRIGEGTTKEDGYYTMFTGRLFTNLTNHPNVRNESNGIVSTAAGAYQFLYRTWSNLSRKYSFKDFSQSNQDLGAIALIAGRNALVPVMNGQIDEAIHLCRNEWASLPGSSHGQPTVNKKMIIKKYEEYLLQEKSSVSTLHASDKDILEFIELNYPEVI
ncbi:glycoside hydrolase family 24 protein [Yokenella regensburgei]|uniref:glycoside hydrolase family 24 protein n=1 Tax=Yokenella regensburgei TaxID=158877 RepID=UPI003ED932DB